MMMDIEKKVKLVAMIFKRMGMMMIDYVYCILFIYFLSELLWDIEFGGWCNCWVDDVRDCSAVFVLNVFFIVITYCVLVWLYCFSEWWIVWCSVIKLFNLL